MYKLAFLIFLMAAAFWDLIKKEIPLWIYVAGAVMAVMTRRLEWVTVDGMLSIGIGGGLFLLALISRERIGKGDGVFFLVSGMFLESRMNAALFFYGLMLCSVYCLWMEAYGHIGRRNRYRELRKTTVPFLPFLVPVGIWLITGGSG